MAIFRRAGPWLEAVSGIFVTGGVNRDEVITLHERKFNLQQWYMLRLSRF